jgi:two-component system OmpR family response regulator
MLHHPHLTSVGRTAVTPIQELERCAFPLALRVMCVDDNRDVAESLADLLRLCGAAVEAYHDGHTALRAAELFHPQVAILDVMMPGMGGCELARRLRAVTPAPLLLIAQTGVSDAAARGRTADAGFDMHVTKPGDPVKLIGTLANFMWWLRAQERSPPSGASPGSKRSGPRGPGGAAPRPRRHRAGRCHGRFIVLPQPGTYNGPPTRPHRVQGRRPRCAAGRPAVPPTAWEGPGSPGRW